MPYLVVEIAADNVVVAWLQKIELDAMAAPIWQWSTDIAKACRFPTRAKAEQVIENSWAPRRRNGCRQVVRHHKEQKVQVQKAGEHPTALDLLKSAVGGLGYLARVAHEAKPEVKLDEWLEWEAQARKVIEKAS